MNPEELRAALAEVRRDRLYTEHEAAREQEKRPGLSHQEAARTATPATTKQQEHNMSTTDSTARTAVPPTGFHELEDWFDPTAHTGLWVRPEVNVGVHGVELYLTWTPERGAFVEDRDGEALNIADLDDLTTRLHRLRDALMVAQAEHRAHAAEVRVRDAR